MQEVKSGLEEFIENIIILLQERLGGEYTVQIYESRKNNGERMKGIRIHRQGVNIAPVIYMELYYQRYRTELSMEEILNMICEEYKRIEIKENFGAAVVLDWHLVKDLLRMKLVSTSMNWEILEKIPHRDMLDLSLIPYIRLRLPNGALGYIEVEYEHIKEWQVTSKEVLDMAWHNTIQQNMCVENLKEVVRDVLDEETKIMLEERDGDVQLPLYEVTNNDQRYGAVCMAVPQVLESLAERLGGSYYILPSSVHEIIVMREDESTSSDYLSELVHEVNESQVQLRDRLSDHVYRYSSDGGLVIAA